MSAPPDSRSKLSLQSTLRHLSFPHALSGNPEVWVPASRFREDRFRGNDKKSTVFRLRLFACKSQSGMTKHHPAVPPSSLCHSRTPLAGIHLSITRKTHLFLSYPLHPWHGFPMPLSGKHFFGAACRHSYYDNDERHRIGNDKTPPPLSFPRTRESIFQ